MGGVYNMNNQFPSPQKGKLIILCFEGIRMSPH